MLFTEQETNIKPQSVSVLANTIQNLLENNLGYIKVRGEISGFTRHSSGHYYFSVKDEEAAINVAMWSDRARKLGFKLENGMEVVISGKISSYAKSSRYSIIASNIELYGEGQILKIIQQRREKLEKLGFFDKTNYLPKPKYPESIGLITSQTGAVIVDIIKTLEVRFCVKLKIYNSIMQGQQSPESIIDGLKYFSSLKAVNKVDVVIIARGGGSVEDLFYFNDEKLVRAVHNFCKNTAPVISAIGHGVDTNLIDLAASFYAVTPTAAVQIATPDKNDLKIIIDSMLGEINSYAKYKIGIASSKLDSLDISANLSKKIEIQNKLLALQKQNIDSIVKSKISQANNAVQNYVRRLEIAKHQTLQNIKSGFKKNNDLIFNCLNNSKVSLNRHRTIFNNISLINIKGNILLKIKQMRLNLQSDKASQILLAKQRGIKLFVDFVKDGVQTKIPITSLAKLKISDKIIIEDCSTKIESLITSLTKDSR